MISSWDIYTKISCYVKCSSLFFMNNYILPCDVRSVMWKNSTWPHLHYTYAFFLLVFVHIYQKHNFVQICTACKGDTRQKCIFDVICHVIFHIVFAELKLCMVMISVITVEIWCTYMLYSNIVSYWKLSYVKV